METKKIPSDFTYSMFHGLLISLMLVCYFLFIKSLGYGHISAFRFFNTFILAFGIFSALKQYKKQSKNQFNFLSLYKLGALTSIFAIISFGFFMLLYLNIFNPSFMNFLIEESNFGIYLSPFVVFASIVIEGISACFMITFICTQYLKKNVIKKSIY